MICICINWLYYINISLWILSNRLIYIGLLMYVMAQSCFVCFCLLCYPLFVFHSLSILLVMLTYTLMELILPLATCHCTFVRMPTTIDGRQAQLAVCEAVIMQGRIGLEKTRNGFSEMIKTTKAGSGDWRGGVVSSPSRVRDGAPAIRLISTFWMSPNALGEKKMQHFCLIW